MERRYMLLSDRGVRNIEAYNRKIVKEKKPQPVDESRGIDKNLPYIVLVIDELADLMMTSSRDVEEAITRLAQMARAAGIHLIIATQRPSVDVLTGIIKANFPTRISFQVSSKVDSRTILDGIGAENLLGEGDMLFLPPGVARVVRIHGAFISEEEVKRVTDFLRGQMKPDYDPTIVTEVSREEGDEEDDIEMDEKFDRAVDLVIQTGQASISMIQRKLRVGYNRAARMIEAMEKQGIVGPSDGIRPRDVYGRRSE
jgi:S-DNA-T family DNA segregation ATPase FtsK/SpoIIIE